MKTCSVSSTASNYWWWPIFLTAFVLVALPAAAQTADSGKWEIEFHGGGLLPTNTSAGTASLPGPGQPFTNTGDQGVTRSSRFQSSWYLGDGTILFNQIASGIADAIRLGNTAIVRNPALGFSPRIVPLDAALGRSLGERRRGGSIGARVSRVLTPRLGAELTIDYGFAPLNITQANRDTIEATRASFLAAFDRLTSGISNFTPIAVTSTAALERGGGHQLFTSGALSINLRTTGKVTPYATVGAGLISRTGKTPGATLMGNYRMVTGMGAPLNETDNVTVRDARDNHTAAAVLGGGVKYSLSRRWGIRLDIRTALSMNTARTVLDTNPNVVLGGQPSQAIAIAVDPTVVFSNTSAVLTLGGVTGVRTSSLAGPAISGLRTFSGSGVSSHTNIVTGMFWRF